MIAVASVVVGSLLVTQKDRAFVHPHRARVVRDGSDESRAGQLEPAANRARDREVLETERADVAACWQGQPRVTDVHLRISGKGVPVHVTVQSEAPWTVRTCNENVLQRLDFAKGRPRAIDYAF